ALDLDTWNNVSISFDGVLDKLIFEFEVFQSNALEKSGLYFRTDNLNISAQAKSSLNASDFTIYVNKLEYEYTGEEIELDFSISSNIDSSLYSVVTNCDSAILERGEYEASISILDSAFAEIKKSQNYTIEVIKRILNPASYTFIRNEEYATLRNISFYDKNDLIITSPHVDVQTIYPIVDDKVSIKIKDDNHIFRNNTNLYEVTLDSYSYTNNKGLIVSDRYEKIYDGTSFDINDVIEMYSAYNQDTDTKTPVAATTFVVEYRNESGEVVNEVKNIGTYTFMFEYNGQTIEGTIDIIPKAITGANYIGTDSFNKTYDGTSIVPINGYFGESIDSAEIELMGIVVGDEVSLTINEFGFIRPFGKTAIHVVNYDIVGEDGNNYILDGDFYINEVATISPAKLAFTSVTDLGGERIIFDEKVYNGLTDVEILNEDGNCLSLSGLGTKEITYSQVTATASSKDVGTRQVTLVLNDPSLFGFFQSEILMQVYPEIEIKQYELNVDDLTTLNDMKDYDGTVNSDLVITYCEFDNLLDFGDNLATILADTDKYEVVYSVAYYDTEVSGIRRLFIEGIELKAYSSSDQSIFDNYSISDFEIEGIINPVSITVDTEIVRILEGGAVPNIRVSVDETNVVTYTIHNTQLEAENDQNPLSEVGIEEGEYYLRVVSNSDNYRLDTEYVLVRLVVSTNENKTNQEIRIESFTYVDENTKIIIMEGGYFDLKCFSYTESSGLKTDLPLTYAINDGNVCSIEGNIIHGIKNGGQTVITISQSGNTYYKPAESISFIVEVKRYTVHATITPNSDLYYTDYLPREASNYALSVNVDSEAVSANINSVPTVQIKFGENQYVFSININTPKVSPEYTEVYGVIEVPVNLIGIKKQLDVYFDGAFNIKYKDSLNLVDGVDRLKINSNNVLVDDFIQEVNFQLKQYKNSSLEDVSIESLLPGNYVFYAGNEGDVYDDNKYYILINSPTSSYEFELHDSINVCIEKGIVSIGINNIEKNYYAPVLEDYSHLIIISGKINSEEEVTEIKENIDILLSIGTQTGAGTYPIQLNINDSALSESINNKYEFVINDGYAIIYPLQINIQAESKSSIYLKPIQQPTYKISIQNKNLFTDAQIEQIENYINNLVSIHCDVESGSNVGEYPIILSYSGNNVNYNVRINDSIYTVRNAEFSNIYFYDKQVKYDGLRHKLEVVYTKDQWPNATISYDFEYFTEPGEYKFRATISQANYETLILTATLIIGVDSFSTTTQALGSVELEITDENCTVGVNSNVSIYGGIFTGDTTEYEEQIAKQISYEYYDILNIYYITFMDGNLETSLGYSAYKITFAPKDIKKTNTLVIYGYNLEGDYTELEYEYSDGKYTIEVSDIRGIAFVEEVIKKSSTVARWAIIVAIVLVALILAAFLFSSKKFRNDRRRSRKRHNRWA
nr:hypothetical protein [Clostridia bacterium]